MDHNQRQAELDKVGGNVFAWLCDTNKRNAEEVRLKCKECGKAIEGDNQVYCNECLEDDIEQARRLA